MIWKMHSRRFFLIFLLPILWLLIACDSTENEPLKKLVVGVVSYGEGSRSLEQYADLKEHLGTELKSLIEFEPALNEIQAIDQIERQNWDLVFAPPGLAAIAISQAQYVPVLPREGGEQEQSVIVVRDDHPSAALTDLGNQAVALGQKGSAAGYYFPVFNLYGLTLAEIKFGATPKEVLKWVNQGEVVAGALSLAEFERYRSDFKETQFRILYRDSHLVPSGSVLVGPDVDEALKTQLLDALESASPGTKRSVGYISNAQPPNYEYLIKVVKRVQPIAQRIREKPAPLYEATEGLTQ
ncbi:PhnD/SsuA/transferrin family substrate-binding protein [Acaryochloris sp. IP29b_bin.137]|uniref:phosphate/phosphite/phosphonate ABC transporter substrate-binding protein n=1 Tax=Acaryochloris sp. IP29b_bin.137 TaxID=2969217 RepID=UPI00260D0CE8|nr:PhnD/SsuA/transferrin family substrate-binding protein [Acaryochloris sp. IP29b_bin.137]